MMIQHIRAHALIELMHYCGFNWKALMTYAEFANRGYFPRWEFATDLLDAKETKSQARMIIQHPCTPVGEAVVLLGFNI